MNEGENEDLSAPTEIDPIFLFRKWMERAEKSEPNDPNAMALATTDKDGMPNVRIVLLKEFNEDGFAFYTNYESTKGKELLNQPKAACLFHWKTIQRQVRIRGHVIPVKTEQADLYFNHRHKNSQIGAWASQQSSPLETRGILEQKIAEYKKKYRNLSVPRPPHWSGFRIQPLEIEFWIEQPYRLHDRLRFQRPDNKALWEAKNLYP
ncbi:MAG: pyridoxamine 5'-phosphate oxidase [Alphaproteobacteria bacterium]|nr:pyridoxamine 5'-phosphate oxidase [Alphaproteobacteria bacterium]